jgi:hypothetical protein
VFVDPAAVESVFFPLLGRPNFATVDIRHTCRGFSRFDVDEARLRMVCVRISFFFSPLPSLPAKKRAKWLDGRVKRKED